MWNILSFVEHPRAVTEPPEIIYIFVTDENIFNLSFVIILNNSLHLTHIKLSKASSKSFPEITISPLQAC